MTSEIFFTQIVPKFAGSLVLVYLLTRFFRKQFVTTIKEKDAITYSFIGSATIIGLITYFTMGFAKGLIWYLPGIVFWLVYDMVKYAKKEDRLAPILSKDGWKKHIFQTIIIALLLILIALQFIDLPVFFRSCKVDGKYCEWHYLPMDRNHLWRDRWGF